MEKRTLKEFLDISILNIESKFNLTVSIVIELLILFAVSWLLIFIIKKAIYKSKRLDIGKKFSLSNLIKYAIYIISFAIFLSILGTDLKFVLAGSAALLVGIGLGLQNLFSDFVSGIIILMDSLMN